MKVFRQLTSALVPWSAMVAAGAFAVALAIAFVVSMFREIEISAWKLVVSQLGGWFTLALGVHVVRNVLPVAVAHGRTRREFVGASAGFVVVLAAAMTAVVWLGILAETGIYSLMGWWSDWYGTPLEYFLMFAVCSSVGMFCAASFDRYGAGGILSIPVGVALVVVPLWAPRSDGLPFVVTVADFGAHLLSAVALVVALAGTWLVARDMPIRVRAA